MATVLNPNAAEDEPLRINLDDAEIPTAAAEKPAAVVKPADGVEELKRQLAAVSQNREQWQAHAQRKEHEARQQSQYAQQQAAIAQQAQERGILSDEVVVETRMKAVDEQMESLTKMQGAAYSGGEWDAVADINRKMAALGGERAVLETKAEYLLNQRQQYLAQQQQRAAAPQQQQPQQPTDPFERALAGRTPRTQQFLRQHRDLVRPDGSLKRVAVEAHEQALDDGLRVDTDDYFRKIEELLGSDDGRTRAVKGNVAKPKGPPTVAAGVSRGGSVPGQINGSEFVMSARMRELAQEQGVEPAEWASQYVRLIREGKIDPIE